LENTFLIQICLRYTLLLVVQISDISPGVTRIKAKYNLYQRNYFCWNLRYNFTKFIFVTQEFKGL